MNKVTAAKVAAAHDHFSEKVAPKIVYGYVAIVALVIVHSILTGATLATVGVAVFTLALIGAAVGVVALVISDAIHIETRSSLDD